MSDLDFFGADLVARPRIVVPTVSLAQVAAARAAAAAKPPAALPASNAPGAPLVAVSDDKKDKKNWLLRPVLGKLPGAAVVGIGAGLLGGIGFAVKKIFFRR